MSGIKTMNCQVRWNISESGLAQDRDTKSDKMSNVSMRREYSPLNLNRPGASGSVVSSHVGVWR